MKTLRNMTLFKNWKIKQNCTNNYKNNYNNNSNSEFGVFIEQEDKQRNE